MYLNLTNDKLKLLTENLSVFGYFAPIEDHSLKIESIEILHKSKHSKTSEVRIVLSDCWNCKEQGMVCNGENLFRNYIASIIK